MSAMTVDFSRPSLAGASVKRKMSELWGAFVNANLTWKRREHEV